jgi:hypothetical protein
VGAKVQSGRTWSSLYLDSRDSQLLRWYFRKLKATGSLFLDINSSLGIDSTMELIARRNRFILYEDFLVIHLERERGHMF